ncbi:MAG: hypothetical protein U0U67_09465 [Chitinophagales bacterium]
MPLKISVNSFFILIALIFIAACTPKMPQQTATTNTPNTCLQQLKPNFQSVLYNTQVNVVGNHLSGLLLVKKMSADTTRILFTSETGIKFFDFELTNNTFAIKYCIKKLNKKVVTTQLQKVFRLILMNYGNIDNYLEVEPDSLNNYRLENGKENVIYSTLKNCSELKHIETSSNKHKPKISITLDGAKNGIADVIFIQYHTFSFDISLKQIDR